MAVTDFPSKTDNLAHYQERVDLAAAFRWCARLNLHEGVANHFSLSVNEDGTQFLMNPNQVHFSRIKASDLLLIDAAAAALGSPQPDLFGLKLMTYLDQSFAHRRGQRIYNPVAVVLCKADYCPQCFDDPRVFAKTNLNRVWNICESRFANVEFFATTVIGSLGFGSDDDANVIPIPLHAAPRGILEPFEWILRRLE